MTFVSFIYFFWLSHVACRISVPPTRDRIRTPCVGGMASQPLDRQESPSVFAFNVAHHPGKGRLKISLAGLLRTGLTSSCVPSRAKRELLVSLPSQLSTAWIHHGVWWVFHRPGPDEELVNLSVGALSRRLTRHTCASLTPGSGKLLSCHSEEAILELCDDYSVADKGNCYFDRNPSLFRRPRTLLHREAARHGGAVRVLGVCQEIEYWGINESSSWIPCCSNASPGAQGGEPREGLGPEERDVSTDSSFEESSLFEKELERVWQATIWPAPEEDLDPDGEPSLLPVGQAHCHPPWVWCWPPLWPCASTACQNSERGWGRGWPRAGGRGDCMHLAWFTGELAIRLVTAPCQKKFWKNPLDIVTSCPSFPFMPVGCRHQEEESEDIENMGKVVQILRLMRIFEFLSLPGTRWDFDLSWCHTEA